MSYKKQLYLYFGLLIVAASVYRIFPDRMLGFAPQIAMAIFAGSIIKDKKLAFVFPLLSMLISDIFYELLYRNGMTLISGFYEGQYINYALFALLTLGGFLINAKRIIHITIGSLAAPTIYFILSNFSVWLFGGGYHHPITFDGLLLCYTDGLPFYKGSLLATVTFSAVFFGIYYLINIGKTEKQVA